MRIGHIFIFQFLFTSFCFSQLNSVQGFSLEKLDEFSKKIETYIEQDRMVGAEVLIHRNDETVWHKTFGLSNQKNNDSLERNSIYYIQSMTKPIISVAIMQLVEKGKINLDDPLEKYIPEAKQLRVALEVDKGYDSPTVSLNSSITITQLLSHTSGFSHGLGNSKLDRELFKKMYNTTLDYDAHKNLESRIHVLLKTPLIGQPGKQFYYSASPDFLALILQRVSKMSIPAYLKKNIFEPLQMNDTGYNLSENQSKRVMALHQYNKKKELITSADQVPTNGNTIYGGTHGLFSTAQDYLSFCQMILNEGVLNGKRILKKKTVRLMKQNHVGDMFNQSGVGFGLGFGIVTNEELSKGDARTGQLRWGGYFNTQFFIDPKESLIALLMTQRMPYSQEFPILLSKGVYNALID